MSRIKFAVIGGDYRYKLLAEILENENYEVNIYGNKYCENTENIGQVLKNANVAIAPIPISKDDINIYMDGNRKLTVEELTDNMARCNVKNIICGVISNSLKRKFSACCISAYDLFDMEEVAINNAIPTAEGAVMTAIQESDRVLFSSKILIIGYGRCGKILANMLKGIGGDVTVTFRKKADEAYIRAYSYTPLDIRFLENSISGFDFVFNTAPAMIMPSEILKRVKKSCVIIDLAQAPGGLDYNYARELNLKAVYCPGLPGRIAPYTAAQILKTAILNIVPDL